MSEEMDLGPCCGCGRKGALVRNLVALDKKAPIPGHGWGCVVCHLPPDGAQAVLCDVCCFHIEGGMPLEQVLSFAWRGRANDGLVPVSELTGSHRHDMAYHQDEVM